MNITGSQNINQTTLIELIVVWVPVNVTMNADGNIWSQISAAISGINSIAGRTVTSTFNAVRNVFTNNVTTNTMTSDVYAYIFDQKGLMAGLGVQGSKITKISK